MNETTAQTVTVAQAEPFRSEPFHCEPFQNEPHTDFSRAENRDAFAQALTDVGGQLGLEYPLIIDGKAVNSRKSIVTLNPSHSTQTVGRVAAAIADHA